jgi:hypothetical protein
MYRILNISREKQTIPFSGKISKIIRNPQPGLQPTASIGESKHVPNKFSGIPHLPAEALPSRDWAPWEKTL